MPVLLSYISKSDEISPMNVFTIDLNDYRSTVGTVVCAGHVMYDHMYSVCTTC